eukprot:CAMPEP_0118647164 /NCGR_PEP_ID=MMETSP0785-20121206/8461_1 /TAXON_ID=91992 /ORGANISM="Bolidomonas pacifica, Strain CCMP 1866" /LENGTH=754 /DNA_ID=CAMNT_0006539241 /DNA_START=34 /DNA_END=2298 /DNA_ORIENTATION=+
MTLPLCLSVLIFVLLQLLTNAYDVSFDNRRWVIDGQETFLIGGSFHYPRATPDEWPDIFSEMKANGLNLIQTYVFWDLHEPTEGEYNFPDDPKDPANLVLFLQEAQKAGLYVHLRVGPYACAEWSNGGIPIWMETHHRDTIFRTDDDFWIQKIKDFWDKTFEVVSDAGLMASAGGPIVMAQIENEYGNIEYGYGSGGAAYVKKVADYATSHPISKEVPIVMCQQGEGTGTTPPENVINACNGYYCDNWIEKHSAANPDHPHMFTENWPGWFQKWGEAVPHRPASDVAFSVARWFAKGGSFMNYYMTFGGTSFGRKVGGPNIITSYDYDVAINEYGYRAEPKFSLLTMLHEAIYSVQDVMFAMEPVSTNNGTNCEIQSYYTEDKCVQFLSNIGSDGNECEFHGEFKVPSWSTSIVVGKANNGQCSGLEEIYGTKTSLGEAEVPNKVAYSNAEDIKVGELAVKSTVTVPTSKDGPSDTVFLSDSPIEQLALTDDKTDYLWYTFSYNSPADSQNSVLEFEFATAGGVGIMVFVDGELKKTERAVSDSTSQLEDANYAAHVSIEIPLKEGANDISVLSSSMGLKNYGPYLERNRVGIVSDILVDGKVCDGGIVHTLGMDGEFNAGVAKKEGEARSDNSLTWYTTKFSSPNDVAERVFGVDLSAMGKGAAYLNGYHIGRFWNAKAKDEGCNACDETEYSGGYAASRCRTGCGELSQTVYKLPSIWFKAAGEENELLLFVEEAGEGDVDVKVVDVGMEDV